MNKFRVTLEQPDGTHVEVDLVTDMRDQVRYERAQAKYKLPPLDSPGATTGVGMSYFALKRSKSPLVDGCTFEQYLEERCVDIEPLSEETPADPTQPAPQSD